ncbi:hypothetical protein [Spiroplasma tabanidicola]|uniref:Uncharacterized protein n=1 Tax=Spiroplasma tabanidicola TaxID=324079 RepID=A0A6I6C4V3_9MOLU|nr:hypothetical protein [Spiroplasma tabanidicola]QGS51847.1 hypothetical protein STABA_v1c04840 [Spiroplasma tabanidicola]
MDDKILKKTISIKTLRLWGKNPRYTDLVFINIEKIGSEDFIINENLMGVESDMYKENYRENMKKLLAPADSPKLTYDLIESMMEGFDSSIDDMFVVRPVWLDNYNYSKSKDIYYVVEGNRRLLVIDLLSDRNSSRKYLKEFTEKLEKDLNKTNFNNDQKKETILKIKINNFKKILAKCEEYDKNPKIGLSISCKVLDYNFFISKTGMEQLNKVLNSRHFGKKKGKMNWPRGLILKKIYSLIVKFVIEAKNRSENIDWKVINKKIENTIGKTITSSDLNNAIFFVECINAWNADKKDNEKIKFGDTENGDIDTSEIILYNDENQELLQIDTEDISGFSVSALELAKTNLIILDKDLTKKSLSKVIKFVYEDKEKISDNSSIIKIKRKTENTFIDNHDVVQKILKEITNAVYNKEITTRSSKNSDITESGKKIRQLIFPLGYDSEELKNNIYNISLEQIGSINPELIEDVKIKVIVTDFQDIDSTLENNSLKYKYDNSENNLISNIKYIWLKEFELIKKFKNQLLVSDISVIIFSSLLRTTIEVINCYIFSKLCIFYLENIEKFEKKEFDEKICNIVSENIIDTKLNEILSKIPFETEENQITNGKDWFNNFKKLNENDKNIFIEDVRKIFDCFMGCYVENTFHPESKILTKEDIMSNKEFLNKYFFGTSYNGSNILNEVYKKITTKQEWDDFINFIITEKILGIEDRKVIECFELIKFYYDNKILWFDDEYKKNSLIVNRLIHKSMFAQRVYELSGIIYLDSITDFLKTILKKVLNFVN